MEKSGPCLASALFVAALVALPLVPGGADARAVRFQMPHSAVPQMHEFPSSPTAGLPTPVSAQPDMTFHGGAVLHNPKAFLVFWGWGGLDASGEEPYLVAFFQGIGGSPYAAVQTQYADAMGFVTNPANQFGGAWVDDVSPAPFNGMGEPELAAEALRAEAHFGYDPDANYFIATPSGASDSEFAANGGGACAWHSWTFDPQFNPISYTNFPYQTDAPSTCGTPWLGGALDGVSIVAGHEYEEAVTDPFGFTLGGRPMGGWITDNMPDPATQGENGDKCAWIDPSLEGGLTTVILPTGTFAVQTLWSNANHDCIAAPYGMAKFKLPSPGPFGNVVVAVQDATGTPLDWCIPGLPGACQNGVAAMRPPAGGNFLLQVPPGSYRFRLEAYDLAFVTGVGGSASVGATILANPRMELGKASSLTFAAPKPNMAIVTFDNSGAPYAPFVQNVLSDATGSLTCSNTYPMLGNDPKNPMGLACVDGFTPIARSWYVVGQRSIAIDQGVTGTTPNAVTYSVQSQGLGWDSSPVTNALVTAALKLTTGSTVAFKPALLPATGLSILQLKTSLKSPADVVDVLLGGDVAADCTYNVASQAFNDDCVGAATHLRGGYLAVSGASGGSLGDKVTVTLTSAAFKTVITSVTLVAGKVVALSATLAVA